MNRESNHPEKRGSSVHLRGQPGPTIPGYHLLERIGASRTATIYRAIQLSMQREVALRILDPELVRVPGFAERYMQEARSTGAIYHANVVCCYDVGLVDGYLYQAMELILGQTLEQFRGQHNRGVPVSQALAMIADAVRGLEAIHRGGLMHGDIRLRNIFITDDEVIKLADFGLVRSRDHMQVDLDGTRALMDMATLAPEQFNLPSQQDIRADVYSLAAVLYVLLTGQQPFSGRTRRELERQVKDGALPDARLLVPSLPADVIAVMKKAMAKIPSARYATPSQLREDIERVQYDFSPLHALGVNQLNRASESPRSAETRPETNNSISEPASSPTRTIAKDAHFLLVPRAQAHRINWLIIATVAIGALSLAFIFVPWNYSSPPNNPVLTPHSSGALPQAGASPQASASPQTSLISAIPTWKKPAWSAETGEDNYGRWAKLVVHDTSYRFRYLSSGRFVMGSLATEPAHRPDEQAVSVFISHGFWLGESEVTQAFYQAVAGQHQSANQGADLPVENITWHECLSFTKRINTLIPGLQARLPTEAEWEYSCRAGLRIDEVSTVPIGWFNSNEISTTHPVMKLPSNAWGLYDMSGNVMEWCQDNYGPYPTQPATDPVGSTGVSRVVRGGAWAVDATEGYSFRRAKYSPIAHHAHLGFRLVINE
jgi:serine/threonine protein kinase